MRPAPKTDNDLIIPLGPISEMDDPFIFDDALRILGTSTSRHALISAVGASGLSHWEYERQNRIPAGTVELALMTEDATFQQRASDVQDEIRAAGDDVSRLQDVFIRYSSFMAGVAKIYPQGFAFMQRLSDLSSNARLYNADPMIAEDSSLSVKVQGIAAAHVLVLANVFIYANLSIVTEAFISLYAVVAVAIVVPGV